MQTSTRQLSLDTLFDGKSVRYEQQINKFTLYIEERGTVTFTPKEAISIYREGKQVIEIIAWKAWLKYSIYKLTHISYENQAYFPIESAITQLRQLSKLPGII